ncbi:LRR receptor-like serine/threonine-protein kinase [Tripterygium wilfordii]|uniref:LRR receptor-like serine/threonine-protein kinase n=1 Tax=Tripterygium wilfordii TaxID=458696 RepID=A0A7J7CIF0_TRIWF|nr:LRR receptor-like serine/threonine-protein kinase [Tripterygium wilfordii]
METPRTGTNFLFWSTDKDFTKSGINMRVPGNPSLEEMSTLRFFPNNQAEKSCYTLPAYKQTLRYTGILFPEEKYNRIWTRGFTPSNSVLVTTVPDSSGSVIENDPPISVMRTSIMSNTSDPIFLSVDLRDRAQQSGYFVFYFTETGFRPNSSVTRIVDIYINGVMKYTVGIELNKCRVVTVYPVIIAGPTVNITLAQSKLSTLPPIISAMEVFSKVNTNQANGSLNGVLVDKSKTYGKQIRRV